MQLKAAILSAFLAIAPASAHLRNVHDMNNKNGATTIDDEAALRSHITSWIDELKDSTAANNDSRRLDTSQHCVDVKDSAAKILASALEGCGTAASGSLAGGIATNESPNPTCLLLLCEAHFKAAEIIDPECTDSDVITDRNDILACRLTPGYLPPNDPIANADDVTIHVNTLEFVDVLDNDEGTFGFDLELRDIVTPAEKGRCWPGELLGAGKMGVHYQPNKDFIGQDSCVYEVCYKDRYADQCDNATVTIDVNAQPTSSPSAAPTAQCDITLELTEAHVPLVSQETCDGKLNELKLKYNGGDCNQSNNEQGGKFECKNFGDGPTDGDVEITVFDKNGILQLGNSPAKDVGVSVGDILRLEPPTGYSQFQSEIIIKVRTSTLDATKHNGGGDPVDPDLLQEITIHTSCSQDLRLLDIFGSTQVFAYTDTKKDAPVTVVQPVTVSGGLVNNNAQCIVKDEYTLSFEDQVSNIDFVESKCFEDQSFEKTMMTDLSQESLEYTLEFNGKLDDLPGQECDETIDETFTNRNLGPTITELVASLPGTFSTLKTALDLTNLLGVLDGPGPWTVFAPTDAAFANLPEGALEALVTEDPPNTLKGVLLYHVAQPDIESKNLSNGQVIETFDGGNTVEVAINADGIFINQAEVTGPDNLASNGVAHIIDAVLIPGDFAVPVAIDESV